MIGKIMQYNWSSVFWFITQQLNLFSDMGFHRIMTRTILGKLISRKSNDKVSRKCKKPHIGCAIWDHLSCELKCLFFLLYFSFYTIFGDTATLERSPSITPYGKFGRFVFLFWLLHMQKIHVILLFHQEIYVLNKSCNLIGWKPF